MSSISTGSALSANISGTTTPADIIHDIQTGKWANEIKSLRTATGDEADKLKRKLPAILWSGTFRRRKNDGLLKYSGLICADIDKIPDRVVELQEIARHDPYVVGAFVSPSGTGLKIVFQVPADANRHVQNFVAIRAHAAAYYKAKVDEAAKNIARLCFVSHDPNAFYNASSKPLDIGQPSTAAISMEPDKYVVGADKGNRNNTAFELACRFRDIGQTQAEATEAVLDFARQCIPPLPDAEARTCVRSAYSKPPRIRERPLPEMVDATTFMAKPIESPTELIAGILHRGSKLAFGGSSKSFKTWNLLHLALSVATGANWLGFSTTIGKVLFVNLEIQPHALQKRIVAVAEAGGVELRAGQLQIWNLRGYAADYGKLIPKITERAHRENFELIVLDPIYKLYGATDENSAGDVAALLNSIESLSVETGAAVAYGCHFAKGNASTKEAIDRISGSGVFARDPDSLLIFTKHIEVDAFTVEPILRNFEPIAPFVVRWQFPLMRRAQDLDPTKLNHAGGRPRRHHPQNLLNLLPKDGLNTCEWRKSAQANRISESTFHRLIRELKKAEKIHIENTTGKWKAL